MAVFLSLLTAALFGTGDFLGGLAGRRMRVLQVLAASHLVGLAGITAAALLLANEFIAVDLAWGALAGSSGLVGLGLLYRGLAVGPMGVVAPLTAITSAAVPAAWGVLLTGDVLSGRAWLGVVLALSAIALVSWAPTEKQPVTAMVVLEALLAGAGFGFMFVILDQTDPASAPWSIVGGRLLTGGALLLFFLARRERIVPTDPISRRLLVALGGFDAGSNALFLYAADAGSLTIAAVLSSLYPVSTVVLARIVLKERLTRGQQLGFIAALAGAALIAVG